MKIILFGFDGLRPDCVNNENMPRLNAFLKDNVYCQDNRSVFPTETYVNHPSIFSGFLPYRHGIIANGYFDPEVSRKDFFLGSIVERIESAENKTKGKLFQVPTLTETLTKNGLSCFSISSNSPGSTRLIAHKTSLLGGINISVNGLSYALPESIREKYVDNTTDGVFTQPDLKGLLKMNEIVHDIFQTEGMSDLNIIWYGEPDNSFHAFGIGAEESKKAIWTADQCFGEILDKYWDDDVQIIVASDHGHITVKKHFDITQALVDCGFKHGKDLSVEDVDFTLLWGYSGNIYVHNLDLLPKIVKALQGMPEIGMLFTRDRDGVQGIIEGTFSSCLVSGDHYRAGDIRFILRHFNEKDKNGYNGTCICADSIGINGGIHGGLHRSELHSLLGFGGTAFCQNKSVNNVTGLIDITPTIYHLLGISPGIIPQGRILHEVFEKNQNEAVPVIKKLYSSLTTNYSQTLEVDYVHGIPYIYHGERVY